MSSIGHVEVSEAINVLPLFLDERSNALDPMADLILEGTDLSADVEPEFSSSESARPLVLETQFPDQSMYILEQQIEGLRERMDRLKFYLSDLDDLLPV